jgi:hypothetical protein
MANSSDAARTKYDQAYQNSPIILSGGIVSGVSGGMMPITSLLNQPHSSPDDYIRFLPIPGGNLISNSVGMYPFANQQVAANAIIQQPLSISLLMIAPVRDSGGYSAKQALLTGLRTSLNNHNSAGGLYNIATPAYLYTYCVMTAMTDVTGGDTKQKQVTWQLDFIQPIVTVAGAKSAMSGLMQKLTNGSKVTTPNHSGANAVMNNSPGAPGVSSP